MGDFVAALLHHTKDYESPQSFWKWAAYSTISGVLRDSVWLADGDSKLFPNTYVLFLAGSAQRKGRPVVLAEQLVTIVKNVKVISGRASIQAILVDIGQTETDERGKIIKGGSAIFFAPELAAGIVQDEAAIQILTDIYDYKPTGHGTSLIGRGKSKLDKMIFSMLGASNEELLKDFYSAKAINGGLLGRTFLIMPDEFRPSNAFPKANEEDFKALADKLRKIAELSGAIQFAPAAQEFYRKWYDDFRIKSKTKSDRAGIYGRLPTNVKKLSIILAANQLSTTVFPHNVEEAIIECLNLLPNYNSFILAQGRSTLAECGAILLDLLSKAPCHQLERKFIIMHNWMHFDIKILDETVTAFETSGIIKTTILKSDAVYKLGEKGMEILGLKEGDK